MTEVRQRSCRGLATAWLESGPESGEILLLLHGFPDTPHAWSHQLAAFGEEYRVIAPFMRGLAPSDTPRELKRYGSTAVSLDLLEILADVDPSGKRPVRVVGHDLGAVHAWEIARLLEGRCAGLVVINGLTIAQMARRLVDPRQLRRSWYMFLMQLPVLPELAARVAPQRLLSYAYASGGLGVEAQPTASPEGARRALMGPLNQYRAFLREIPRVLTGRRRALRCPVLVLWGDADAFLLPPRRSELAPDAEQLTIRILPGNHWLHREQAAPVNKLLARFFHAEAGES